MAPNLKISALPPAGALVGLESIPVVQSGETRRTDVTTFSEFVRLSIPGSTGPDTAELRGFVEGTALGTEAATNLVAWNALMASGGCVYFGPGTWNMGFSGSITGVAADVMIRGAGRHATVFLGVGSIVHFKVISGNVEVEDIYWDYGATPMTNSSGHLIDLESKTTDIRMVRVERCRFRNIFNVIWAPTNGVNTFYVNNLLVLDNTCENRFGLVRIMRSRIHYTRYEGNLVDCKIGVPFGGIAPPNGGITHGYVQDNSPVDGFMPEEIGIIHVIENVVRNIKPTAAIGSGSCSGIHINCYSAVIRGNIVEKVYPFFGTARTAEAMFTGNGVATTFTGTLAHLGCIPDSLTIKQASTIVADDNDHGWARGENDGTGTGAVQTGRARQRIVGTGITGWIDYNDGTWSVTFAVAPAAVAYTANYIEGAPSSDIEPIYCKSTGQRIFENTVLDCANYQGAICPKGGGSYGYETYTATSWSGAGGSAYGAIVTGNFVRNRVQTGVFSVSLGVWVQQDFVSIIGNHFEGLCDRLARCNVSGSQGRGLIFSNNMIKDHYGSSICYVAQDWVGMNICDNFIDGWYGTNAATNLYLARLNGATNTVKNVLISNNSVTEKVGVGKKVVGAWMLQSTGSNDVIINGMKSLAPWYGFQKSGTGTGGRARLMNHCLDQMTAVSLLDAASNAVTNMTDDGGFA